ncbi:MAG: hypothetical protein WCB99_01415 [Candidatus Cybelea sp.]
MIDRHDQAPRSRRGLAVAILIVLFVVMCALIAWSQWYAIHVNVPMYRAQHASAHHR